MAEELQLLGIHEPPETREDINAILGEELLEHLVFPVTVAILRNKCAFIPRSLMSTLFLRNVLSFYFSDSSVSRSDGTPHVGSHRKQ